MVSWDMWEHRNGWIHNEAVVRKEQIIAHLDDEIKELHGIGAANRFLVRLEKKFFQRDIEPVLEAILNIVKEHGSTLQNNSSRERDNG